MRTPGRNSRPRRRSGFTLIELIVVMLIVAIAAATAIPSLANMQGTRRRVASRLVVRDLSYARERALDTGTKTWVVFSTGTNSYSVLQENPASPGRNGAVALADPASTGRTYVQYFNTGELAGVSLVSAVFDAGSEVGFDWCGKPLNSTAASLSAAGVVTITGSITVTVQPATGLATTP